MACPLLHQLVGKEGSGGKLNLWRLPHLADVCLIMLFCIVILRPGHSTPRDRRKSAPMRNSGVEVRQVMPCEGEIRKGADYVVSKIWLMCTDPVN